jgi:hypothetical protein
MSTKLGRGYEKWKTTGNMKEKAIEKGKWKIKRYNECKWSQVWAKECIGSTRYQL